MIDRKIILYPLKQVVSDLIEMYKCVVQMKGGKTMKYHH